MVVVLAAPGALLIAIIGLAAILAFYHRQRTRNLHQQQSQSAVQTCDGDDANGETSNYTKTTTNGKPDVIKSKRGIVDLNLFTTLNCRPQLAVTDIKNKDKESHLNTCHLCFGRDRLGMSAR
jgi:hypothetical protein